MRRVFLSFVFFPLIISNLASAKVETEVINEVSGDNASAQTEITNVVNGETTHVESTSPGTIKVEVEDGEVKVESSPEGSLVVTSVSPDQPNEESQEKASQSIEVFRKKLLDFVSRLFSEIIGFFWFSP